MNAPRSRSANLVRIPKIELPPQCRPPPLLAAHNASRLHGPVLNFDLETESEGSSALVRIRGDLDLQVVDQVTDALARIESDEPELLVIDLSRLSFMDSTGMAAIAGASIRAVDAGRRFAIVIPPAGVRQAFERAGLHEVITTTDDLASIYP
jgi:anti-anti-sigma factor